MTSTIQSGNVTAGTVYGIYGAGALTVRGGGTLSVTSGDSGLAEDDQSMGIFSSGELTVNGGTVTSISGKAAESYGMMSVGALTIDSDAVTGAGGLSVAGAGIFSLDNLTIIGGTIAGSSDGMLAGYGLFATGKIAITGDTVTGNGGGIMGCGISADEISITGGTVTAKNNAIDEDGNPLSAAVVIEAITTLTIGSSAKSAAIANATEGTSTITTSSGTVVSKKLVMSGTDAVIISFAITTYETRWGAAKADGTAPDSWVNSGTLTDAMTYANTLASGTAYIQLLTNVDTIATLEFASGKTTVLDLNGKTIDGDDIPTRSSDNNVLIVNGNLTLCDSSTDTVAEQGKLTGGHGSGDGTGGGVYVHSSGIFTMTGGNITGNTAVNGGGVANEGTFTLTEGSISGNAVENGTAMPSMGGGVANLGSFNMSGGSITDNTVAIGGTGGGIANFGTLTLSGSVNISGNNVGTASDNVALIYGTALNITAPLKLNISAALANTTPIGVSIQEVTVDELNDDIFIFTPKAGVFTDGSDSSDYISKFVSDNSDFAVIANDSQLKLAAAQAITKAVAANGRFTVKVYGNEVPTAREGQTVTVTPTASSGYELDTITVCKTDDTATTVPVTNGSFTMPAYGVTVNVTFRESGVPAYTISGTIKGSDTVAGIPASLQLKDGGGNVLGTTTAAANGSYSFTGVPAGSYTVAVSCTGYDSGTITGVTVSTANLTGKNLTLTKSISGLTDAQKLAAAKAAIMAAINRMSFSNSTTAADILSVAQAASLYGVTVAWDNTNEFTKTQATTSATGSIRGTFQLVLNQESDSIGIDAAIAKLSTGGDNGGGGSDSGGSTTSPSTKPTEPVTGSTENKATVDNKGNANVSLTDKNITDAIADAKAEAAKKGVNAGDITAVIHVTTGGKDANTVTVNLPKTTQEQVIGNKIASVQLVIDRPDLTLGIDLAAVTEINRQAKADVQLSATRMDNAKLSGDAKAAIGNRPAYDLKTTYGNGKSVTDFGKGSVSVEIPYTLQKGEIAGNVCAVYVDAKGKVTYLTDSSYDAKRGTVVLSTSHFSTYGVAYKASFNFTDIAGHWAKDDILFVANRGLMTGTSATTFSPNGSMTRGMFVTALGRLANADISTYKQSSFIDVKADAYYMGYIEWGVKNNILVGIGDGKFNPDGLVTREQMAVMMDRYATAIGFKLPEVHTQNTFADNTKIGAWAASSVKRIQMAGIIQGKNNNIYDPQGTATRAEVSAVLRRFVELTVFSDTAQGWVKNDSGQWMFFKNGKALTGWQTINGKVYCFDSIGGAFASGWKQNAKGEWFFLSSDGSAVTGWKDIGASGNSKRYYFDTHGVMIAGKWLQIDGKWYYFYADGSLAKSTKVDGYEVDKNGVRKAK